MKKQFFPVFPVFFMGNPKKLEKLEKLLSQEKLGCMYLVCEKAVFPVFSVFPLKKTEKT